MSAIVIGLAGISVLILLVWISRTRRQRHLTLHELPSTIHKIDHEAAARIADLWEQSHGSLPTITRKDILQAVGGSGGFKKLRQNVSCMQRTLPDPAQIRDIEVAELLNGVINDCRSLCYYLDLAIAEEKVLCKMEIVRPLHCAQALWKYQQLVDMFYQLITAIDPQVVEGLEFVL